MYLAVGQENNLQKAGIVTRPEYKTNDLITKKPLEGNNYIKVADHFVAMSIFDSPNYLWWYPFQDSLYKGYGGKNWKKEENK